MMWQGDLHQTPDLSVIIVNYNTGTLFQECIASLLEHTRDLVIQVLIVDNDSHDGSADFVAKYPEISFIHNDYNVGFARANNQALTQARGTFCLLLNPDTVILPAALQRMIRFLDQHPDYGAVCPRTYLDRELSLEICSLKIPTPYNSILVHTPCRRLWPRNRELARIWQLDLDLWQRESGVQEVEGIGGACFMLRRETLERIGLLDERFYMGYEDTDWSLKVRTLGLRNGILTDAEIVHYFGQSKRKVDPTALPIWQWHHGLLPFLRVHYPGLGTEAFCILKQLSDLGSKIQRTITVSRGRNGQQRSSNSLGEIGLSWDKAVGPALIEISNSPVFFDKFGARVSTNKFTISLDVINRLASGRYWWRVYPRERYQLFRPRASGTFIID